MDASSRRPQLPALSYLDIDKVKREDEYTRHTGAPPHSLPPVTAPSPTYLYPSGPPPPYSQPSSMAQRHANSWSNAQSNVHTPPESRRTSGDDQDAKQRQSLPSISEALGVDSQAAYHSNTLPPSQPPPAASTHQSHTKIPASPLLSTPKRYGMDTAVLSQPPSANGTLGSYAPSAAQQPERSTMHANASQSMPPPPPQQPSYGQQPQTSPSFEQLSSAGSMGPPHFPYGYTPYPPKYARPTPPATGSSGPIYQPSANYPPPSSASATWRSDSSTKYSGGQGSEPGDYSASVKRHLDLYDLEGALNEVAASSSILSDFSRRYGDRLHQTTRSGTPHASLPGMVEVNDMIAKSRAQVEALLKIREVVIAQQAAFDLQLAEQRPNKHATEPMPPAHERHLETDEAKGGFAGPDTKKRRGRAAPPGRCHSCNRAETPEWRRGPDGARTLCNACGLHYAKLTRKQQGQNKAAAGTGSSNLRPKES